MPFGPKEGIETDEQLAPLKALGCDYAQAYLFSRPAPFEDLFDLAD